MNVLEELTNKRTRMVADLGVVEQAIKALTPVLGNGHTKGDTAKRTPRQRARMSEGMKTSWVRRKAA